MCDYPFKLTHLTACHPSQWSKITISISGDALNFFSSFICPKRVSNRLKVSSNFCVQFWFLQFRQCSMFWTRLCVIILLSLFLSFAISWFSPLGLFFIVASWLWHGWLVDNPSICVPKGVQWGQGSIHLLCSFFCIFLWCFYVLYKTLCDHPSQPIPVTIESLFIIGSLAWCARLIALSASFWLCEIDVELFLGRFRSSPTQICSGGAGVFWLGV